MCHMMHAHGRKQLEWCHMMHALGLSGMISMFPCYGLVRGNCSYRKSFEAHQINICKIFMFLASV